MFRLKAKYGSDEIDICGSLVVTLIQSGAVRLTKARWPVMLAPDGGPRVSYVRLTDVESFTPIQSLTGFHCDEHGTCCP